MGFSLDRNVNSTIQTALDAIPFMDESYRQRLRSYHFENYDDWPFLWGQNEGTIAGNTQYIIFGSALKRILLP